MAPSQSHEMSPTDTEKENYYDCRWTDRAHKPILPYSDDSPSKAARRLAPPVDTPCQESWLENDDTRVMRSEAKREEEDGEFVPLSQSSQESVFYPTEEIALADRAQKMQGPTMKTKSVKLKRQGAKFIMERNKRRAKRTESTDEEPFTRPESTERREPLPPPAWLVPSIVPQLQWLHDERDPRRKPCSIDRVHELKEKLKKEIPSMSTTEADFLWLALIDMDKNWRLRWSDSAAVFADFETKYGRRALKDYNINHYDSPYTVADRT